MIIFMLLSLVIQIGCYLFLVIKYDTLPDRLKNIPTFGIMILCLPSSILRWVTVLILVHSFRKEIFNFLNSCVSKIKSFIVNM